MLLVRIAVLSGIACLVGLVPALGANICNQLPIDHNAPPSDGHLYVRSVRGWQNFQSLSDIKLGRRGKVEFAYVVRPIYGGDRTGVLVIKTNRPATDKDSDAKRTQI